MQSVQKIFDHINFYLFFFFLGCLKNKKMLFRILQEKLISYLNTPVL